MRLNIITFLPQHNGGSFDDCSCRNSLCVDRQTKKHIKEMDWLRVVATLLIKSIILLTEQKLLNWRMIGETCRACAKAVIVYTQGASNSEEMSEIISQDYFCIDTLLWYGVSTQRSYYKKVYSVRE